MTMHICSPREALYISDQIYIQENVKNYINSRKIQIYIQEFFEIYIQESFNAEQYTFNFFFKIVPIGRLLVISLLNIQIYIQHCL